MKFLLLILTSHLSIHLFFNFKEQSNSSHNGEQSNHNKKIMTSSHNHISISNAKSTTSQVDFFQSHLRFESPLRSNDPYFQTKMSMLSLVFEGKEQKPWPHFEKPMLENIDLSSMLVVVDGKFQHIRCSPKILIFRQRVGWDVADGCL